MPVYIMVCVALVIVAYNIGWARGAWWATKMVDRKIDAMTQETTQMIQDTFRKVTR